MMNSRYNVEEWAAGTTKGRQIFNYNFRMFGRELRGWEMHKIVTMQKNREATEKAYIWLGQKDREGEMDNISVTEVNYWRLAQKRLHDKLSNCMRPDIPRGTGKLTTLGDVNFVGRDLQSDIPAAIFFARGNLCISVSSIGEKDVDVSEIATTLDRALSEPPTKVQLKKEQVQRRTPEEATVKADEAFILIENLREVTPPTGWLQIVAPDGELRRKGNALIYVSSRGGKKSIRTYVLSA
jgi:hypothetical protein